VPPRLIWNPIYSNPELRIRKSPLISNQPDARNAAIMLAIAPTNSTP
jgi:hypothetical protein